MKIILVRHGETDENAKRLYLGHTDAKLNANGREQLHRWKHELQEAVSGTVRLYTSDLSRAVESAAIISEVLPCPPVRVRALRELHFGDWDCLTYEHIAACEPELFERWMNNPFDIAPPNGETLKQLGNRVNEWINSIMTDAKPDETIIIVSHGGPIRWLLSKWLHGSEQEFWHVEGVSHGAAMMLDVCGRTGTCSIIQRFVS